MSEPYAKVPRELRRRIVRELGDPALSVFLEVFDLCHSGKREFEVSHERIARELGRSESAVDRSLKRLRDAGFIDRKRGRNKPNLYSIQEPAKVPVPEPAKTPVPDGGLEADASAGTGENAGTGTRKNAGTGTGENAGAIPAKTPVPSLYKKKRIKEKKSRTSYSPPDMATAQWMFSKIKVLFKNGASPPREPNFDSWADTIRLMRERDRRTDDEIRQVFEWANQDSFWRGNILSPSKLRKQFESLSIQSQGNQHGRTLSTSSAVHKNDRRNTPGILR